MAVTTTTKSFAWGKNYDKQNSRQQTEQIPATHSREEELMPLIHENAIKPGGGAGRGGPEIRENRQTAKAVPTKRVPGGEWDEAQEGLMLL